MRIIVCWSLSLLICSSVFSELYVTFPTLELTKRNGFIHRNSLRYNLSTFIESYLIAKKYNGTLVCMPMDVNLYQNVKIKKISYREYFQIKRFIPLNKKQLNTTDFSKDNYLYEVSEPEYQVNNLSNSLKKEILDVFLPKNQMFNKNPSKKYIGLYVRTGENKYLKLKSKQLFSSNDLTPNKKNQLQKFYSDVSKPLEFPPLQFYVNAMKFFVDNISKDVIFILFTDSKKPNLLCTTLFKAMKQKVPIKTINSLFKSSTSYSRNFGILFMDGFITPRNFNFTLLPLEFSNYSYWLYPEHSKWINNCLLMTNASLISENGEKQCIQLYN